MGSDILSVLHAVQLPEMVLGQERTAQLRQIQPNSWYPIRLMLELMDAAYQRVGTFGMRKIGRTLFQLSHRETALQVIKDARQLVYGLDAMYHHANRGEQIGGWHVLEFGPGSAKLEKTTPHHCVMEEGILLEAFATIGTPAYVRQDACFRQGAEACTFTVSSAIIDERWLGKQPG